MVEAAPGLAARSLGLEITHQTGERDLELVKDGYRRAGLAARVEPFLFDMAREMKLRRPRRLPFGRHDDRRADGIVAAGDLHSAADRCRRSPARERGGARRGAGAAEMIEQRELTGERLAGRIAALLSDEAARRRCRDAAHRLAHPDAAAAIVERVFELAEEGRLMLGRTRTDSLRRDRRHRDERHRRAPRESRIRGQRIRPQAVGGDRSARRRLASAIAFGHEAATRRTGRRRGRVVGRSRRTIRRWPRPGRARSR